MQMEHIQKALPVCRLSRMRSSFERTGSPMCTECEKMLSELSPNKLSSLPRILNDNFQKLHLETVLIGQRLSMTIWESSTSCTLCSRLYYEYGHFTDRNDLTPVSIYCSIRPDRFYIWTGVSPDGQRLLNYKHYRDDDKIVDNGLGTMFTRSQTPPESPFNKTENARANVTIPSKHSDHSDPAEFLANHKTIIFTWLLKCSSEHRCRTVSGFLPTRLVRVGTNVSQTKLVYSQSIPAGSDRRYVTLSHSWGGAKFTTLTRGNHERFLESIKQNDLTWVFKDAMKDSEGGLDWKKEAPKMAQIYQNSQLNLAASGSWRGADGLIQPCRWPLHHPCWFQTQDSEWWIGDKDDYPPLDSFRFSDQPLHQRGWVMQELFLAPRTLHFTQDGLVWQCKSCVWTEFAPATLSPSLSWRPVFAVNDKAFVSDTPSSGIAAVFHALSALSRKELENEWFSLARMYTMCKFTFDNDRATALIGMARTFEDAFRSKDTQTEYIWGFWKHRMIWDLAWHAVPKVELQPNDQSIAPSWSWMTLLPFKRGLGDRALQIAQELQKKNPGLHNRNVVDLARITEVGARFPLAEDGTSRGVSNADFLKISGPVITVTATRSRDLFQSDEDRMMEEIEAESFGAEEDGTYVNVHSYGTPWTESYKYLHLQHDSEGKQALHLGRSECYAHFDKRDVRQTIQARRKSHLEIWVFLYAERMHGDGDEDYNFHGLILEPKERHEPPLENLADVKSANIKLVRTGVVHVLPNEELGTASSKKEALLGRCIRCRQSQKAGNMQNAQEWLTDHLKNKSWEEISSEVTIY